MQTNDPFTFKIINDYIDIDSIDPALICHVRNTNKKAKRILHYWEEGLRIHLCYYHMHNRLNHNSFHNVQMIQTN